MTSCVGEYASPLGAITLACEDGAITGLWFSGQKYFGSTLSQGFVRAEQPVLSCAREWLDAYFSGHDPGFLPSLRYGSTPFRRRVLDALLDVPYGATTTYGELAARVFGGAGEGRASARAVGGAVGHNPISLMIPCHRVLGADGALTGYAGGVERKACLLELERRGLRQPRCGRC